MEIFNQQWMASKYQLFIQRLPRASGHTSFEEFETVVKTILFVSSKEAEHQFCLSDKTVKKIKDLLAEEAFE